MPAPAAPRWMVRVLLAAAAYNVLWGGAVILFPEAGFRWIGIDPPRYPALWQCIGMIVGVYGVGYALAARDPFRHWPIVLVGLLGKVLGPLGFLAAAGSGQFPWRAGAVIVSNDLVWWVPFGLILAGAARAARTPVSDRRGPLPTDVTDQHGRSLVEISADGPTLAVFLRHFG